MSVKFSTFTKVVLFVLMAFSVLSCQVYPNGRSLSGNLSYKNGDDLSEWQSQIRPDLTKFLFIQSSDLLGIKNPPRYSINSDSVPLDRVPADVLIYHLSYQGFEQVDLSAYLLLPKAFKEGGLYPSLIYLHGHGSNKEEAAFDKRSYVKGMGLEYAKKGYVVLVPDIRGFGKSGNKDHVSYAKEGLIAGHKPFLVQAALDALVGESFLENLDLSQQNLYGKIDTGKNAIEGVSLGGNIALLAGALDERFEVVGTFGIFTGLEVLFSKAHHFCQHIPALLGHLNVFDLALLVMPRKLEIGMGGKDKFYNGYSVSAIQSLKESLQANNLSFCDNKSELDSFCNVRFSLDPEAGHEFISSVPDPF